MNKTLLAALSVIGLGACAGAPDKAAFYGPVGEVHPITVDQQTVAVRVPIDATRQGLGRAELASLDAFLSQYRTRGHGPVTVTAPVGSGADQDAQEAAANVRAALYAAGLPYEEMRGASLTTGAGRDVVVSFQSYVATGPACGRGGGNGGRLGARPSADFGCADQANLAAMIADPRDLHAGRPSDGVGDDALVGAITARAENEVPVVTYTVDKQ